MSRSSEYHTYEIVEKVDTESEEPNDSTVEEIGPIAESWVKSGGLVFLAPAGPASSDPREVPPDAKMLARATEEVYVKNLLSLKEFDPTQFLCVVNSEVEWQRAETVKEAADEIESILAVEGFIRMSKLRFGNLNLAKFLAPETGPYGRRSLKQ